MCSASKPPAATPTPPPPETVKRVESEVTRARDDAKKTAARRYGVSGTNITGGALNNPAETKKNKLGGA